MAGERTAPAATDDRVSYGLGFAAIAAVAAIGVAASLLGLRDGDRDLSPGTPVGEPVALGAPTFGSDTLVLSLQRMTRAPCLKVERNPPDGGRSTLCARPTGGQPLEWGPMGGGSPYLIAGLVARDALRIEFEYFDGRIEAADAQPLDGDVSYFVAALPTDGNVRFFRSLDGAGRVLEESACHDDPPAPFGSSGCSETGPRKG